MPASFRHLVPGGLVGSLIVLAILSPFISLASWLFDGLIGLYILVNVAASLITCRTRSKLKYIPLMPLVFASYHFGYGYGFLRGVIDFVLLQKLGSQAFGTITRGRL